LFLALGIVGPFFNGLAVSISHSNSRLAGVDPAGIALGLRFFLIFVALIFGILGRRSRTGRIGMIGSGVVLAVALAMVVLLVLRHATPVREAPVAPAVVPLPPP
jgi:hypothetical protein